MQQSAIITHCAQHATDALNKHKKHPAVFQAVTCTAHAEGYCQWTCHHQNNLWTRLLHALKNGSCSQAWQEFHEDLHWMFNGWLRLVEI